MPASALPAVLLGTGGPPVGSQGLGCMGFSEFYGPRAPAEAEQTLQIALSLGVTLFDTGMPPRAAASTIFRPPGSLARYEGSISAG